MIAWSWVAAIALIMKCEANRKHLLFPFHYWRHFGTVRPLARKLLVGANLGELAPEIH
jgi:hypothetical protein